ncbi:MULTISPECIES: hypothetical protein [Actinomadura]|uniref:Uncharacterized protein n=1 Tax=Actinomadura yumaensis TaxID=111807 RepID=A0ABW2CLW9_9ACTN|nr:hypothetical protein [Actinomadura sp. J1-007]MWK37046.1 hypothetical protein [Actinomadura sp. J1-007]
MQSLTPSRVDREFAALVYADDQWLREEFDALMTAAYGAPPRRPGPPAPPRTPPTGRPWRHPVPPQGVRNGATSDGLPRNPALDMRRQRSPPPGPTSSRGA